MGNSPASDEPGFSLDIEPLAQRARFERLGARWIPLAQVDSTNRFVLEHPANISTDGWIVLADHQSAGRGRLGRNWHCPRGAGLLCTVGLECDRSTELGALLSLITPVAICEGLSNVVSCTVEIKWPNDLMIRGRKLGGILIESKSLSDSRIRFAIGFGVNCLQHPGHFPPELRDKATSLDISAPEPIDRLSILGAILSRLDAWLVKDAPLNANTVCERWKSWANLLGHRAKIRYAGRDFWGNVIDIDPSAALIVQLDEGGRRLFPAAESSLLETFA